MIMRLWTTFLLTLAGVSTIAWLVALMHEKNIRPAQDLVAFFKKQSKAGRVILGTFFIVLWIIASTKPGDGGGNGGDDGAKTFQHSRVIFHEGAVFGNVSEGTGSLLASAQLLPFHSNQDKGLLYER